MVWIVVRGSKDQCPRRFPSCFASSIKDRDAKVAGIRIHPGGVVNLATGEPVVFTATAYDDDGEPVTGAKINWDAEAITVGKKNYKGKFAISRRGEFASPEAGEFIITALESGHIL